MKLSFTKITDTNFASKKTFTYTITLEGNLVESMYEALYKTNPDIPYTWDRYDPKLHNPCQYVGFIDVESLCNNAAFLVTIPDKLLVDMISFAKKNVTQTIESYEIDI